MGFKVKAEVYSRVSGYYRPVDQWNPAKREEKKDRKEVNVKELNLASESSLSEARIRV